MSIGWALLPEDNAQPSDIYFYSNSGSTDFSSIFHSSTLKIPVYCCSDCDVTIKTGVCTGEMM